MNKEQMIDDIVAMLDGRIKKGFAGNDSKRKL